MFQKELTLIKQVHQESMFCHYWYFKGGGYKFQQYLCTGCHAVLMMVYELKSIAILNAKGIDYGVFYGVLARMRLLIG